LQAAFHIVGIGKLPVIEYNPVRGFLLPVLRGIYLYENGIRTGEVYVPDRVDGQTQYTEHWVLYPNYLYPGPKFLGPMQVVPVTTEKPYASDAEFFKNVPFAKGSKYVRVDAEEFTSLPVAR
jgi:hypothetical protein